MISLQVFYEGHVQGVGFRFTVRHIAKGFDVTGWVRNLPDGRVELQATGDEQEVRAFLDGVVTSIYAFEGNGRVREYVGGYSDWRQTSQSRPTPAPRRRPSLPAKKPRQGLTYLEQRELDTFPERIETLEAEQVRLHAQLEDPDLFRRDPTAFQTIMERLTDLETALPAAYARWEELERRQTK